MLTSAIRRSTGDWFRLQTCKGLPWGLVLSGLLVLAGCTQTSSSPSPPDWEEPALPFNPRTYVLQRAPASPDIDGRLEDEEWQETEWTAPFVNNRGPDHDPPSVKTRAKMMWDEDFLYIAAELEEPDVRASFTTRDTSIWRENAFELFIDPTGDTHNYYEFQINARETRWDLLLTKPYRDGGRSLSAWDIRGLKMATDVQGTLNDPSDEDEGWTVELALPWSVLEEAAPGGRPPQDGEQWRLNLTRMQWPVSVVDGQYVQDSTGNESIAWSPHGERGYHTPERWGIVQFSQREVGREPVPVEVSPNESVKWALRQLYYRQQQFREAHDRFATTLSELEAGDISIPDRPFDPDLQATQTMYEITASGVDGSTVHLRQDGKVWTTEE